MEGRLTGMDLTFINTEGKAAAEKVGEMSKEKTAKAEECRGAGLTDLTAGGKRKRKNLGKSTRTSQ